MRSSGIEVSGPVRLDESSHGRRAAFDDWVAPHMVAMRRFAVVSDPVRDPDDLVQEALERAWTRWETYTPDRGSARPWLLAIVADRSRRRRMRSRPLDLVPLDPSTVPTEDEVDSSERLDLRRAIAGLSSRQRQAVLLFYYVDLSVDDVAAALCCSPGTVKSTLSDARARLAGMLGDDS